MRSRSITHDHRLSLTTPLALSAIIRIAGFPVIAVAARVTLLPERTTDE